MVVNSVKNGIYQSIDLEAFFTCSRIIHRSSLNCVDESLRYDSHKSTTSSLRRTKSSRQVRSKSRASEKNDKLFHVFALTVYSQRLIPRYRNAKQPIDVNTIGVPVRHLRLWLPLNEAIIGQPVLVSDLKYVVQQMDSKNVIQTKTCT